MMKPFTKLERQYIAYWVMNIIADYVPGVHDEWGMDCPTHEDRLRDTKDQIIELGGYPRPYETAE